MHKIFDAIMLQDLIITRNRALIEAVELTDLEKDEALFERKKKKFFREKNAEYWESLEKPIKEKKI